MLVFIDESGDTGLKTSSSRYFIVALISFEENDEANACDQRIQLLKRELKLLETSEFKFNKLRKEQRIKFFEAMSPYTFFYFAIVINKAKNRLYGEGFRIKESFYKYTCSLVFENAKPYLKNATVIIDGSGSREFKKQFKTYLRRKIGSSIIKKVKIQTSHSNNLIQLADMIGGAVHRSFTNKSDKEIYRKMINAKEIYVQVWPK